MEEVFITKDLAFIYTKLLLTIQSYKARFPELSYINMAIDTIIEKKAIYDMDVFDAINSYIKENLLSYYSIRIVQHRFEKDIEIIRAGDQVLRSKDLYLEFAI